MKKMSKQATLSIECANVQFILYIRPPIFAHACPIAVPHPSFPLILSGSTLGASTMPNAGNAALTVSATYDGAKCP